MKKLNKFVAVLVALAMMATLCVVSAFAVDKTASGDDLPAGYKGADATLYKVVQVPNSAVTPNDNTTYNFSITAGTSDTVSPTQMAAVIKNATFSIKEGDMSDGSATKDGVTYNTRVGSQLIKDLFDFTSKVPGEYVYTIKETGHTAPENTDPSYTEVFTDDTTTEYTVHLYVDNTGTVTNVTIVKGDEKVKTTVETPTSIDPTNPDGATIVNKYERKLDTGKNPEGGDLTDGVLSVKKTVPGTQGDKTQQFKFKIKLDKPATETALAATPTWSVSNTGTKPASIPYGQEVEFTLADGEELSFAALPAGVTYKITENLAGSDHATNYFAKMDAGTEGAAGANVDTGDVVLNTVAATNNHEVTNRFDESKTTPTGILISNLPYIALALVAIGGLVAYVVVRRRDSEEA